jgi:hypothetical protein
VVGFHRRSILEIDAPFPMNGADPRCRHDRAGEISGGVPNEEMRFRERPRRCRSLASVASGYPRGAAEGEP